MERTVANSLIGTFLNTLDNFSLSWQSFNISAFSTVLVLCLLYLLFVRKILEGFRNRIDRSKQLLQIIPGSILSGNEGIAKKMSGY
jgi:di/tricarboxylate transporter